MKLQVKTFTGGSFLLEWSGIFGVWKVRNTSLSYIKNVVLGRTVEKPELNKPLFIYLEKGDLLQSGIITDMEELI